MSVHSSSTATTSDSSSSTRLRQLSDEHSLNQEEGPFDWDEDPSFSSAHFHTSTPLKPTRARRIAVPATDDQDGEDEELLRASDTESLEEQGEDAGIKTATRLRLTRRSLSQFTSASTSPNNSRSSRPFSASSPSPTTTPRAAHDVHLSPPFGHSAGHAYAPTPSTGSSTLVERDEVVPKYSRSAKGKAREDLTIRASRVTISTLEEDRTAEEEDGSSSSPRPLRSKAARRQGELSSYIDAKTASTVSTPPPPSRVSRSSTAHPSTPLAPGAYPPTARKPLSRRSPPSPPHGTPTLLPSGSKQVHDAFKRYITGPDGALTHSAERRAAAAAAALNAPGSARRTLYEREPPTPHPAGYYAFSPSTSLPVESARDQRMTRERLPSSEERRRREVTWREDVAGGDAEGEEEEDEQAAARAGDSPLNRVTSRAGGPSKLERTLRHMSQLQRETEGRRGVEQLSRQDVGENDRTEGRATQQAGRSPKARTRDYEGDYSSEDEGESEDSAPRQAQRSAIDFAMARSFAASDEDEEIADEEDGAARLPVDPSPSRRSRPSTPPSPTLPDLPPTPSPQSSPTKVRAPLRRTPITQRVSPSSPARLPPAPQPPFAISPPRTSRSRQPSYEQQQPPTSSTPPRRHIAPPQPQGTPLAPPFASSRTNGARALSASLNPPRPDPVPTPRRRANSLSPSREPSRPVPPAAEDELPGIVAELAVAVRALSDVGDGGARLRRDGLPSAPKSLAGVLARRKKESDGRRRGLENELRGLKRMGDGEAANREEVLDRLGQAQEVEVALADRIDELLRGVEQMGQVVGDQVASVVQETLHLEARKRNSWYAVAFCLQLFIFWIAVRIANARASDLFSTIYHDPFSPSLFHLSVSSLGSGPSVLPQTLELFGSDRIDSLDWLRGTLRQVLGWGLESVVARSCWGTRDCPSDFLVVVGEERGPRDCLAQSDEEDAAALKKRLEKKREELKLQKMTKGERIKYLAKQEDIRKKEALKMLAKSKGK